MLTITFYGVRGSTPCSCESTRGFGGNTSCVLVDIPGEAPIICDIGTGARYLAHDLAERQETLGESWGSKATVLLSHLHWDHIQGIPFFRPLLGPDCFIDMVGPPQLDSGLAEELTRFIQPPAFPISFSELPGHVRCIEAQNESITVGSARVACFDVPHVGPTNGYRIDRGNGSVAYVSDHQQPRDGSLEPGQAVVDACRDVDILIHDSQYSPEEFAERSTWGHCTVEFAAELARRARVRRLVLFHHDPTHDDDWIRAAVSQAQSLLGDNVQVIGAAEGLSLTSG